MSARGFEIGLEHAAAQMAATIAFADGGSGNSTITLYTSTRPATGDAPGVAAQVTLTLGKPCAIIAGGVATLQPLAGSIPMVMASGVPLWARWERSDGKLVADGKVTDNEVGADGEFRIIGGVTEAGNDSPTLQAGGLVILGPLTFY